MCTEEPAKLNNLVGGPWEEEVSQSEVGRTGWALTMAVFLFCPSRTGRYFTEREMEDINWEGI